MKSTHEFLGLTNIISRNIIGRWNRKHANFDWSLDNCGYFPNFILRNIQLSSVAPASSFGFRFFQLTFHFPTVLSFALISKLQSLILSHSYLVRHTLTFTHTYAYATTWLGSHFKQRTLLNIHASGIEHKQPSWVNVNSAHIRRTRICSRCYLHNFTT